MNKEISVIIPVYNAEKTIEKCVESIIYGEFSGIEVILVEDCSKDNSWKICQSLSEKFSNVYCYQNKDNYGVSYTRNYGLDKASGKYVLFVDSDDWVSGKYVKKLIENAKQYDNSLVICGLHFYDNILGEKRDYIWEKDGEKIYYVKSEDFFELQRKFHLQQLWNKVFRKDIIDKYNVRFDVTQSMGEDFQFVLDYMEAAKIEQCVVVNEPLYYYIRANNSSLMSQFGLIENENEYRRLEKLLKLSGGESEKVQHYYVQALQATRKSYVYFISRAKNKTIHEKLIAIENIMKDGQARYYYCQQKVNMMKETVFLCIKGMVRLLSRICGKYQRLKNVYLINKVREKIRNDKFSIISQNCIGGVFYHDMKMEFLSPTINLFFDCPDFVRFVSNLEYYIGLELQMKWGEEYPIGILGDITIHFMHYQRCTEAKMMWEKRKKRICWDKILVISTDMEAFSNEVFEMWKTISYPKILYSAKKWEDESCVYFPKYEKYGKVADLIPKREFYKKDILLDKVNKVK